MDQTNGSFCRYDIRIILECGIFARVAPPNRRSLKDFDDKHPAATTRAFQCPLLSRILSQHYLYITKHSRIIQVTMSTAKKTLAEISSKQAETTPAKTPLVEAIEEDDEFEEFNPAKWDASDEDAEDAQQWQDNWDDDDIEDDFTKHLRAELTKNAK